MERSSRDRDRSSDDRRHRKSSKEDKDVTIDSRSSNRNHDHHRSSSRGDNDRHVRRSSKKHRREVEEEDASYDRCSRRREERRESKHHLRHRDDDDEDDSVDRHRHRKRSKEKSSKSSRHDRHSSSKRHKRDHSDEDRGKHKRRRSDDVEVGKTSRRDGKEQQPRKLLKVDKSKLVSLGEPLGHPPDSPLDAERDYFAYHKHLWLYLYRDCSTAFDDLSSDEARRAFADFCQLYNAGKLERGFYAPSLPVEALEECQTTRHKWSLKISDQEDKSLQILQEGVHKQTEYQAASSAAAVTFQPKDRMREGPSSTVVEPPSSEYKRQSQEERLAERTANRRLRDHVQTVNEELTGGRAEGRERQIEKRKELSAKIHGASRRDQQEMELNDDTLYGSGGDVEYSKALAASKQRSAANQARKQTRIAELEQNEVNRHNAMLESLGLSHKIGKKIEIQPRDEAN